MNCTQHLLITAPVIDGETARVTILYLYTGAMMRDLRVEQYHMVGPKWHGSVLTQWRRNLASEAL